MITERGFQRSRTYGALHPARDDGIASCRPIGPQPEQCQRLNTGRARDGRWQRPDGSHGDAPRPQLGLVGRVSGWTGLAARQTGVAFGHAEPPCRCRPRLGASTLGRYPKYPFRLVPSALRRVLALRHRAGSADVSRVAGQQNGGARARSVAVPVARSHQRTP